MVVKGGIKMETGLIQIVLACFAGGYWLAAFAVHTIGVGPENTRYQRAISLQQGAIIALLAIITLSVIRL
jgi:hypothetical protein